MARMDYCTKLASQLMLKNVMSEKNNLVVSPVSLNVVLNMLVAGLKGRTLEYMLGFLGSKNIKQINSKSSKMMAVAADVGTANDGDDGGPILVMVNGVWSDQSFPLKPVYKEQVLKGIFNCEAKSVDFATQAVELRDEINAWAEAISRGLIKDLLEPGSPSPDTALFLANALYFKGTWEQNCGFDVNRTEKRDFYLLNGEIVSLSFMTSHNMYACGSFDGFKVLEIPYENGKCKRHFSMYFFLPNEKDGLQNLLEKLINSDPNMYLSLPKVELNNFWIPKFKFSYTFDVSKAMTDTGTTLSFMKNPEDLSEMMHIRKGAPIGGSKIIQKACIEIDEKGTEAVAITYDSVSECDCDDDDETEPLISFVANHPFVFMIREAKSGLNFFTGVVLDPNQSN
ncbi:hypothetical protein Vadar_014989 [Vaccinium darrowii]|uniref:Uncharacterized protein n=1 Tax=Vaccinium darrowii TaxID=229202 RepID=A0ACB7Y891_9ERIC|nr:hypothetical protein Vadar_014989 [Vaccinium darrowii]